MHDPMVLVFNVCLPVPVRKWRAPGKRWRLERRRRTNAENLGEPIYPWWHPAGYECVVAGTRIGLYVLAAVWHVEPRGADSGSICKDRGARIWHIHHWSVQVHPWQALRRWLFDRCRQCGRGFPYGYCPTSFSWHPKRPPWWAFWRSHTHLLHGECASLVSAGRDIALDREIIRSLLNECRVRSDESEPDALLRIYRSMEFAPAYRMMGTLGYEWNEAHTKLVKRPPPTPPAR